MYLDFRACKVCPRSLITSVQGRPLYLLLLTAVVKINNYNGPAVI